MSIYTSDIEMTDYARRHTARIMLEIVFKAPEVQRFELVEALFMEATKNRHLKSLMASKNIQKKYGQYLPMDRIEAIKAMDRRRQKT